MFHAGTARNKDGNVVAVGGRVLGISATGKTVLEAQQKAYKVTIKLPCLPIHVSHNCTSQISYACISSIVGTLAGATVIKSLHKSYIL